MKQIKNLDYYSQYWVGLMDGDGSIQVNHWRKKGLQFRLVIKLKIDPRNVLLLQKMQQAIGGSVKEDHKRGFVIWVENHKERIQKICRLFERFPPLTTRLACQLEFLLKSSQNIDSLPFSKEKRRAALEDCVTWYLENRDHKYSSRLEKRASFSLQKLHQLPYFEGWLSGFIEAEGCFTLRKASSKIPSFSISQKGDQYLLEEIAFLFSAPNKIRRIPHKKGEAEEPLFLLEVYKKEVLKRVVSHCIRHPLLGEKNRSFIALSHSIISCDQDGDIK